MKRELITAMLVVLLLIPAAAVAGAPTEKVWGKAKVGEVGVRGVLVELHSADGRLVSQQVTEEGGFFSFEVQPGVYYLVHPSEERGTVVYLFSKTGTVYVDPNDEVTGYRLDVPLEAVSLNRTLTVNVTLGQEPVEGANVTAMHLGSDYVKTAVTGANGSAELKLFPGKFIITVSKEFYVRSLFADLTEGDQVLDVDLSGQEVLFQADLVDEEGNPVSSKVRITGMTQNGLMYLEDQGPFISFSVPAGTEFEFLVLSADGYEPYVLEDLIMEQSVYLQDLTVPRAEDSFHVTFIMVDNETLDVWLNETLSKSAILDFLPYDFVGYLPLQLQLAGVQDLSQVLSGMGPALAVSQPMFAIETEEGTVQYVVDHFTVSCSPNDGGYSIVYHETMRAVEDPDISGGFRISMALKGDSYHGGYVNYTYTVVLPEGFERSSEVHNVQVEGYTRIELDPGVGETFSVNMEIRPSTPPIPHFVVDSVSEGTFYAINATKEGYEVIVPLNVSVKFDATPTEDEESLGFSEYRWDFDGDGVFDAVTEEPTANWTFTSVGIFNVTLNVTDYGGLSNQSTYKVHVDGTPPTIKLTYQGRELQDGEELSVDEGQPINLFAFGSEDNEVAPLTYNWSFSDGAQYSGANISHTFEEPNRGDAVYYLNLTVSDGVGNNATMQIKFRVNDTTPPTIHMRFLKNGVEVEQIEQGETIVLDLGGSEDPEGGSIKEFRISVLKGGEELNLTGGDVVLSAPGGHVEDSKTYVVPGSTTNVTMTFNKYGLYTIRVNATDEDGNSAVMSSNLQVKIGPSPDLTLEVNVSALTDLKEGQTVEINVTVRNIGVDDAYGVRVILLVDGEEYQNVSVGSLATDEDQNVTLELKAPKAGNHTIEIRVVAENEAEAYTDNNVFQREIVVRPAAWKKPLTIAAVIIAVVVALFLFFRRGRPRRPRRTLRGKK